MSLFTYTVNLAKCWFIFLELAIGPMDCFLGHNTLQTALKTIKMQNSEQNTIKAERLQYAIGLSVVYSGICRLIHVVYMLI